MLHCASKLGVIELAYESRYDILFSVGLIKEKPIASCDSNYFSGRHLSIVADQGGKALIYFATAQEIQLSAPSDFVFRVKKLFLKTGKVNTAYQYENYKDISFDIFHPPS